MDVKIYTPTKSVMQSGRGKTKRVVMDVSALGARRPEPLMGWTSSPDTLNQIKLTFDTVEQAIAHAQAQGWSYTVDQTHERRVRPRNYTDNFRYLPPEETGTGA